ncbi:unnamed protein product, partial [Didymodactylos carnosus]
NNQSSVIEDLLPLFENNPNFIILGKRLLNKKRKITYLRSQLNIPTELSPEDKNNTKLVQLRQRLKAKRRLGKDGHITSRSI